MRKLVAIVVLFITGLLLMPLLLVAFIIAPAAGVQETACAQTAVPAPATGGTATTGSYEATAYGPPWGGIQGTGVTATGINLTAGQPALELAVDPTVIPLGSWVHVSPNPFGAKQAFYAGDTGGAILGKHIDVYDWQGRASQDAWGRRTVNVTPAAPPGTGNLLQEITPTDLATDPDVDNASSTSCTAVAFTAPLDLTPGQRATILPNGQATAPAGAPAAIKQLIAAGNQIATLPYPEPDVHYGSLAQIWPAYDCSGSTSFVLYKAGLFTSDVADVSGEFVTWGVGGPGKWITVYANSGHVFLQVAGIVLNTAHYSATNPTGSGPRWQPLSTVALQYRGNVNGGFVQRHPAGY